MTMTRQDDNICKRIESTEKFVPFSPSATSYGMGWKTLQRFAIARVLLAVNSVYLLCQRAKIETVVRTQRGGRIETQAEFFSHKRIGQRTRIGNDVANRIYVRRKNGRCAQPWPASGLTYVETMVRLEPNAVAPWSRRM